MINNILGKHNVLALSNGRYMLEILILKVSIATFIWWLQYG